jgi:branched-chain amino acid transport system substrate-binding protein
MTLRRATHLIFAALLLLFAGCPRREAAAPPAAAKTSPRVGVILPLTGNAAVYGVALRNGIELARSADREPLDLIYEDDRGQGVDSIAAARKLIDLQKVPAIIGGAMSSTAEPIIPICTKQQVVLVSPTATNASLTTMGKYFFRLWPSDNYDGKVMAETAFRNLGLRRVAILFVNAAYGAGIADVFEQNFRSLGGTVVAREGYTQGATDFRTALTKIAGTKPDAIFVPGYIVEVTQILKQARELAIKARFLGGNTFYDPKLIEIAGPAAEGAVFSYPTYDAASRDPVIEAFVAAYKKKYNVEPDTFAAQGYDTYRVLRQALATGARSGTEIASALRSMPEYDGPGGRIKFQPDGNVEKPLRLLMVQEGKFVPVP